MEILSRRESVRFGHEGVINNRETRRSRGVVGRTRRSILNSVIITKRRLMTDGVVG